MAVDAVVVTVEDSARPATFIPGSDTPGSDTPGSDTSGDPLAQLIGAAAAGNQRAWTVLYERYAPLVSAVCRRHRLTPSDIEDVSQMVWMRLVQNVDRLREPRALPGWIVTTSKHEALRVLELRRRTEPADPMVDSRFDAGNAATGETAVDENLRRFERRQALHDGLRQLRPQHRQLLLMLTADPQIPYQEISRRLGIPTGSIGPTRARCLRKLRDTSQVQALLAG
ncbi:MAG TPA: sigma-70 family RNA polymerase sigma factor [Mycobacterium sp.]